MTIQMTITLAIVILMIGMIMSDKFAFGAPPLIACTLLVVTGMATVQDAFQGFIDPNVIMIAGFMAVMAAFQKTSMIEKIRSAMLDMAHKGGFKGYVLMLLLIMIGTSLLGGGNTAYYVLVLTLVSTIPYSKELPTSRILLPLGFATGRSLIPFNVAFFFGLVSTLLESSGANVANLPMINLSITSFFASVAYLVWALVGYRLLPDHPIAAASAGAVQGEQAAAMPKWKENCTYGALIFSVAGMMLLGKLGDAGYLVPGLATAFLFLIGALDFKEVRNSIASPLILMMAGVIGVAASLANTGFTAMVGEAVATTLGSSVSPFVLVLAFAFLTSACATLTGASIGSVFVFGPIAVAACVSLGFDPTAVAAVIVLSAWSGGFLPVDGLPAMIMGMGNYKLSEFWKFVIPMYIITIVAMSIGAVVMFPM